MTRGFLRYYIVGALLLCAGILQVAMATNAPPAMNPDFAAVPRQERIGLVLGGGGAKGLAHIGVLRVLEEMRIPVDYVGGTSMGSIVGGFYASGLSPDEIEEIMKSLDWWNVMKDQPPRRDQVYRRKIESQRYFMNFEMGFKHWSIMLPRSAVAGQKLNYVLESSTLASAAITNFDQLPLPFRCVATDIQSGNAVVLNHGSLAECMRASMAVPGLFTPITIEKRILVDGGLVNNIPVNVVRAMGAETIIAVDVGASDVEAQKKLQLETVSEILSRSYTVLKRPEEERQLANANVIISPQESDLGSGEFFLVSEFIERGEAAARAMADKLKMFSVSEAEFQRYLQRQRRKPTNPMQITAITVSGNRRTSEEYIRHHIHSQTNALLDPKALQKDINRIFCLGDFEWVDYLIHPENDGAHGTIEYRTMEKPWGPNYFHVGFRMETDMDNNTPFALLLNYNRLAINPLGAEWRNDLILGNEQGAMSEFFQPLNYKNRFFVAPRVLYNETYQNYYEANTSVARYNVTRYGGQLDAGMQFDNYGEARIGIYRGSISAKNDVGSGELPDLSQDEGKWKASLVLDQLDSSTFPRNGYYLEALAFLARDYLGNGSSNNYDQLSIWADLFQSFGKHTVFLGAMGGTSFSSDIPLYDQFALGGFTSLAGYPQCRFRGPYAAVGRMGYFYQLFKLSPSLGQGVYLGGMLNAGNTWQSSSDIDLGDVHPGAAAMLGVDSIIGPIYLAYARGEYNCNQYWLSIGNRF
ncbi:MAG: patatin-like phospholipase family protein [Kiritimatiellae bacterium]|nr:patatin-like phospholipase family protein [Kiritimatiellia bacterium]